MLGTRPDRRIVYCLICRKPYENLSTHLKKLNYVLDTSRPANELIVRTSKACLTRADFWTLGLRKEMDSTIGNACLELIQQIAFSKGKNIYVEDLYVCPTWLQQKNRSTAHLNVSMSTSLFYLKTYIMHHD
uniref:Uncharacterized protein n=1 Tax=Lates calcarifer TaxID=8187 RepID=A0A4W6EFC6_LATCA